MTGASSSLIFMVKFSMRAALTVGLSIGWLSGCASFYDSKVEHPENYHQPVQIDDHYNISGRFFIKAREKNYYGNFTWQRESAHDVLDFMSPIGTTVARIEVESTIASLSTGGKTYTGNSLAQMMEQQLGFSLPLSYMHYWLQGIPLANYPVQNRLDSGFSQLNWKIEYLRWQDLNHPQIVQLSNADLRIKLFINW